VWDDDDDDDECISGRIHPLGDGGRAPSSGANERPWPIRMLLIQNYYSNIPSASGRRRGERKPSLSYAIMRKMSKSSFVANDDDVTQWTSSQK